MNNYDLICAIGEIIEGVWFDHIEGFSCIGDFRSNAPLHPIQYIAYSTIPSGSDDAFEGIGWTPSAALRDLYKTILKAKNEPKEDHDQG